MERLNVSDAMQSAMWVAMLASMPVLFVAMGIGLIMGIIQTATSIQEQTIAFIPKILGVLIALMIFGPWMFGLVNGMTVRFFSELFKYVH